MNTLMCPGFVSSPISFSVTVSSPSFLSIPACLSVCLSASPPWRLNVYSRPCAGLSLPLFVRLPLLASVVAPARLRPCPRSAPPRPAAAAAPFPGAVGHYRAMPCGPCAPLEDGPPTSLLSALPRAAPVVSQRAPPCSPAGHSSSKESVPERLWGRRPPPRHSQPVAGQAPQPAAQSTRGR